MCVLSQLKQNKNKLGHVPCSTLLSGSRTLTERPNSTVKAIGDPAPVSLTLERPKDRHFSASVFMGVPSVPEK